MAVDLSTRLQESVLEFSALIEVALLSLSQIQHRRRLNGHPYQSPRSSNCDRRPRR